MTFQWQLGRSHKNLGLLQHEHDQGQFDRSFFF